MSGAYTIDPARSLVLSRGWGPLTNADLTQYLRLLADDSRFRSGFNQLCDLRDVTEMRVGTSGIRQIVSLNPFVAGSRRAVVVASDVAFGMARMYQILTDASPDELEVFRDLDEALRWLGVADVKAEILRALAEAPALPETD